MRAGLSSLCFISPFVRSRAASLAGAAALLVAYSAAAVSPALITQQLVDRGLAAGDVPLVAALALALVAAAAAQSVLSVLAARVLSATSRPASPRRRASPRSSPRRASRSRAARCRRRAPPSPWRR